MYFIVVNFNNFQYTKLLIDSLIKQDECNTSFEFKCVVVNNSTDAHDTDILSKHCENLPYVKVIDCPDNPGYFGGLNRGLELIKGDDKGFVIIGNNDLEFKSDFCQRLLESQSLYPENTHAICPDVITVEGRHQNPLVLNRISTFKKLQYDIYFSHYYIATTLAFIKSSLMMIVKSVINPAKTVELLPGEIHLGIGACYVLTPAFFSHSSKLEFPTFLYGEEAFFSEQIHLNNGILYFDPSLTVYHAESASLSLLPKRRTYEYQKTGYPLYRDFM